MNACEHILNWRQLIMMSIILLLPVLFQAQSPKNGQQAEASPESLTPTAKQLKFAQSAEARIFLLLKRCQEEKGDTARAKLYFRKAKSLSDQSGWKPGQVRILIHEGNMARDQRHFKQAETTYGKALALATDLEKPELSYLCWDELGRSYLMKGAMSRAKSCNLNAWHSATEAEINERVRYGILGKIGLTLFFEGKSDSAIQCLRTAVRNLERLKDEKRLADNYNVIGFVELDRGNLEAARTYLTKSYELNKQMNATKGMANALSNLGQISIREVNYGEALDYFMQSLELGKIIDDLFVQGKNLNNIGTIYEAQKQSRDAVKWYKRSLIISTKLGDIQSQADAHYNIGLSYGTMDQDSLSGIHLEKSLMLWKQVGNPVGLADCMDQLSKNFIKTGNLDTAYTLATESIKIRQELKDSSRLGYSLINLANFYLEKGKLKLAEQYGQQALNLGEAYGNVSIEVRAVKSLAYTYRAAKKYELALDYHLRYKRVNDSILNAEALESIAMQETQLKYKSRKEEQKRKAIRNQALNKAELDQQKTLSATFIGASLAMVLIAFLLLRYYRINRVVNRSLKKQNNLIVSQKDSITKLNEKLEQQVQERTDELKKRNQQLRDYANMNAIQVEAPLQKLQDLLDPVHTQGLETTAEQKALLDKVDQTAQEIDQILSRINSRLED